MSRSLIRQGNDLDMEVYEHYDEYDDVSRSLIRQGNDLDIFKAGTSEACVGESRSLIRQGNDLDVYYYKRLEFLKEELVSIPYSSGQ
jgi:hypothetical protein